VLPPKFSLEVKKVPITKGDPKGYLERLSIVTSVVLSLSLGQLSSSTREAFLSKLSPASYKE
jgi:hypothetical protein